MDRADGERVLEHLQHGCVFFTWERAVVGTVVASVEIEFYLAEILGRSEMVGEDGLACSFAWW